MRCSKAWRARRNGGVLDRIAHEGETPAELAQAAKVMREHCVPVELSPRLAKLAVIDTCGTGGDGANTFNISTASAIVVAAAGVPVAKHGNRAASSQTGSADSARSARRVDRAFASAGCALPRRSRHRLHVCARASSGDATTSDTFAGSWACARCSISWDRWRILPASRIRSSVSPSRACSRSWRALLGLLGGQRALIAHGHGGLDEIAVSGPTRVSRLEAGAVTAARFTPEDLGIATQPNADLRGGDAAHNAALIHALLAGERGARRDAVLINAAAALQVAGAADSTEGSRGKRLWLQLTRARPPRLWQPGRACPRSRHEQ